MRGRDAQAEGDTLKPHLNLTSRNVECRTREVTAGTAKGTELGIASVVVGELGPTLRTEAGLRNSARRRIECLGDAKGEYLGLAVPLGTARYRDRERVVAIDQKHRLRRRGERLDDDILDMIDLARTIKLVAKEIQKHEVARPQAG